MKILIIQQKMIGDVLTSSILFEVLKKKYPESELHYVINKNTFPVVANNPFIDKFHFITPEIDKSKKQFLSFLKTLQKECFDVVIDVYSKYSSNLITLFSKAKIKISKHKWYTSFLYTHTFRDQLKKESIAGLAIENRLRLLKPLEVSSQLIKPKIYLTDQEIKTARTVLINNNIELNRPLFMIGVLGSNTTKTLPFKTMAKVIDKVVEETQGNVLFNYIPNQYDDAKTIYDLCSNTTKKNIHITVFGKSLREFLALTYHCTALIGNEGGATNMAKALNKPTFTIFAPWINKDAWNIFDDGKTNTSVHLKDYKPDLFNNISYKKIKPKAEDFYKEFSFDLFEEELIRFLDQF